jgi:hypothetical protein
MGFKKAHGAPVAWETLTRSTPQNELDMMRQPGKNKKQHTRPTHSHIFTSLPGLNMYFSSGFSAQNVA